MKKKYMNWFLVISWMLVIFIFSSQPGDMSDQNNKFIIKLFSMLGLNLNSIFGQLADFIVRKAAHFTEYFILFLLVHNAISYEKHKNNKDYLISIVIVFFYACSDEFHQAFVPGRGPAFRDVMVDTSGAILALIIRGGIALKKTRILKKSKFKE